MTESLQQSLRRQLLSAAAAGSTAFEISGVIELPRPLEVHFKDHINQPVCVTFPLSGKDPTELQPLLDACSPAMFGLGRQTLHDNAVRKALQLPADRLGLGLAAPMPNEAILDEIGELMMPWAAGLIRAEPYAVNVYSPDGFCKAHHDTPASPDMFGSLVFCLPTEFTGGELIIRSPDLSTSVTHDWGSTSSARLAAASSSSSHGRLAWAAMYNDCEHEIKPITTGQRVTLTYSLYHRSRRGGRGSSHGNSGSAATAAESAAAVSAAQESAFGVQLATALSDASWYPAGVTLGLVLEHSYAVKSLHEALAGGWSWRRGTPANMPNSIEPSSLKGSDLQLYRAARAYALDVKILPVVSLDKFRDHSELTGVVQPGPLSPEKLAVIGSFKEDPPDGRAWYPIPRVESDLKA